MKILHFVWGVLLTLMVGACSNEMDGLIAEENQPLLNFTAGFDGNSDSRTVLVDGHKVEWLQGDKVVLFNDESSATYVASASGAKTTFVYESGDELAMNGTYTAVYPASALNVTDKTIQVKKVQTAVADGFDPEAAICTATVAAGNGVVSFKNVCALLKFNVCTLLAPDAESMVMTAGQGVVNQGVISTDGTISWNAPENDAVGISLSGTFSAGKDYYLLVAPQTFSSGFSTVLKNGNNLSLDEGRSTDKNTIFEASKVYSLGEIRHIEPDSEWYYGVLAENPDATEFIIRTPEEMIAFAQIVNSMDATRLMPFVHKTVKLANDIDMKGYENLLKPIWYFCGTFDGQNHKIKNLTITSDEQYVGLFARTWVSSGYADYTIIKNLTLEGGSITSNYSQSNDFNAGCVGAFVGYSFGRLYNCHNKGCNVYTAGSQNVGGIVGYSNSSSTKIMGCSNSAEITSLYAWGQWTGAYTGGIIGFAHQLGHSIVCCYNTGKVFGTQYSGGIIGYCYETGVYGVYNAGEIVADKEVIDWEVYYKDNYALPINSKNYTSQNLNYYGRYWAYYFEIEGCYRLSDFSASDYYRVEEETRDLDRVVTYLNTGVAFYEWEVEADCPYCFINENGVLAITLEDNV